MIKDDLIKIITDYLLVRIIEKQEKSLEEYEQNKTYETFTRAKTVLPLCSIDQLWTLYKNCVLQNTDFQIVGSCPEDHLAITFGGIYVGIETDGYMHS